MIRIGVTQLVGLHYHGDDKFFLYLFISMFVLKLQYLTEKKGNQFGNRANMSNSTAVAESLEILSFDSIVLEKVYWIQNIRRKKVLHDCR